MPPEPRPAPLSFAVAPPGAGAVAFRVTKEIAFCYGHRLLDYAGKCRHLHGHNGTVRITLRADRLDDRGMVVDFGDVKRTIGRWIDDHLDHRMLLRHDDPALPELTRLGEPVVALDVNPTAENIARLIYQEAVRQGLPVDEVTLWETPSAFATVRAGGAESSG